MKEHGSSLCLVSLFTPIHTCRGSGSPWRLHRTSGTQEHQSTGSWDPNVRISSWVNPASCPTGDGPYLLKEDQKASLAAGFNKLRFEVPGPQCSVANVICHLARYGLTCPAQIPDRGSGSHFRATPQPPPSPQPNLAALLLHPNSSCS